ncbi:MAG TPA: glycosyltransferase family 39 protein [Thermoanaerobaculia bacterium]|nr:glycosyltransferase family 39 protein [Thermoanaerobaculia bacterium]
MEAEDILFFAWHLAAGLGLAATAYVAGRLLLRGFDFRGTGGRGALAVAVGLAALAQALLLLGFAGRLAIGPVAALGAAVHALGLGVWREVARRLLEMWRTGGGRRLGLAAALAALAVAPFFVAALYPPTAFDETLYHLPYARAFARTGSLPFLPELRFPVFPQLGELLFAAMLLLAGDVSAHLVELTAVLATAALLQAWGRRAASPAAGWIAAAAFLGHPIAAFLAGSAYVEPGLALFGCAAVFAAERWRETGQGRWVAAAGFLAGAAAGTKYLGLFFVAAVGVEVLLAGLRRRTFAPAALFALVACLALAPTYGRIVQHTGNPLFPFFPQVFGSSPWDADQFLGERGGARLATAATLLWDVVFRRDAVGGLPPYSPVLPLAVPLLLWAAAALPPVRRWLLYVAAFLLLVPTHAHYLFAVLPLFALSLGVACDHLLRRTGAAPLRRHAPAAACVLLLLPGWAYAAWRVARLGAPPRDGAQREAYLARQLPAYRAVAVLNRLGGESATAYAVHAENMVYLAEGRLLGDWNGPASFARVLRAAGDPEALRRALRRLGATYLLVARGGGFDPATVPGFERRFVRLYADRHASLYRIREDGGG